MAAQLKTLIPQFKDKYHLLGCLAQVINLTTSSGMEVFYENLATITPSPPNTLVNLLDEPDIENPSGALTKIDSTKLFKNSSERSRDWSLMTSTTRSIIKPLCLITYVAKQWNSKFYQLEHFVNLKTVVCFKFNKTHSSTSTDFPNRSGTLLNIWWSF